MRLIPLVILILFLIFPIETSVGAKEALFTCGTAVVGSIFPFMVASKMIILSNSISPKNFFIRKLAKLLGLSSNGVIALILGLICGYPIGGKTVFDMIRSNKITYSEGKKLILFANNPGPAFVIATIGGMFLQNVFYGVIIYVSNIISTLIIAFALRFKKADIINAPSNELSFSNFPSILTKAIAEGGISILNVICIIVFFSGLFSVLNAVGVVDFIASRSSNPELSKGIITGLFEITMGIKKISAINIATSIKLPIISFISSFSGLSIFCQVVSFKENLNIKIAPCVLIKTLGAILSFIICMLFVKQPY